MKKSLALFFLTALFAFPLGRTCELLCLSKGAGHGVTGHVCGVKAGAADGEHCHEGKGPSISCGCPDEGKAVDTDLSLACLPPEVTPDFTVISIIQETPHFLSTSTIPSEGPPRARA